MSGISSISTALPAFSGASAMAARPAVPQLTQGAKAARDFEAQLIANVLESMEKTFAALPGQDSVAGQDDYNYLGTQALASAMADGGGFGIAKLISQHLLSRSQFFPAADTKVMLERPLLDSSVDSPSP